jgi:(Z)-2-((N-methylformamido)methylene)-5-hydroxybutyrolactone dehydrogenase
MARTTDIASQDHAAAARRGDELRTTRGVYVDGRWSEPASDQWIDSLDPATGSAWARIPAAGAEDVDRAVAAARRAFASRDWQELRPLDRGRMLRRLAQLVADNAGTLATLETRDNGKSIRETSIRELPAVSDWLEYFAGFADKVQGETIPVGPDVSAYTVREPVGVVGAILPWNSPLLMAAWKLGPAIAAGNTLVIKPAELTSVTALELVPLLEEAGFPPGTVNVVPGLGEAAGAALAAHGDVDKVAFTGEASTARAITQASTGNLKRLSFELGGKTPNIVFDDADYDLALATALEGAFIAAGQSCSAGSRILVQRKIFDTFVADLVAAGQRVRVGDPLDERTHMGAQTSAAQLEKIIGYVDQARDDDAEILCGGARAEVPGCEGGFFFQPTIIAKVQRGMSVWQDEIFGPVVVVVPFDSEDEAIELANSTRYGLTAGVWTTNIARAHRLVRAIRAGVVFVNALRVVHFGVPFGGVKVSGYGREHGYEAMRMYTEPKSVYIDNRESRPLWFEDVMASGQR